MNFRPHLREEPELNLIPMIDVLIILLIFLVLTTSFSHETSVQVALPKLGSSDQDKIKTPPPQVKIVVTKEGNYLINSTQYSNTETNLIKSALIQASQGEDDPDINIQADKSTSYQAIVTMLDLLSHLGYTHVAFMALEEPQAPTN